LPQLIERFDDVFIIDGGSTDGTLEYVRSLGVRLEQQHEDGVTREISDFAAMRHRSWAMAKNPWILWLDSDEVATPEFLDCVSEIVSANDTRFAHSFVRVPRLPDGRIVEHGFYFPERILRLFHRDQGLRFVDNRPVHEKFVIPDELRIVEHDERFIAPWPEPAVMWPRQRRYVMLDGLETKTDWTYLLRWIWVYNLRSLVGQFLRAIRASWRAHQLGETAMPWVYNWSFFKYRIFRIVLGTWEWMRRRYRVIPQQSTALVRKRRTIKELKSVLMYKLRRLPHVLRTHWPALIMSIVIATLVALPVIMFPFMAGDRYQGINIIRFGTDQHFYLSRAREVLDGNALGQSLLAEGKDIRDSYGTWNEFILIAPFRLLPSSLRPNVVIIFQIWNFIGIIVLCLLIYAFALRVTKNKLVATAMPLFVIGGSMIVLTKSIIFSNLNLYARTPVPWMGSIVLFTYLLVLWRALESSTHRPAPWIILAALSFGASFHTYFFLWSYLVVLTGLLGVVALFRRREMIKPIVIIGIGGILLGLPYLIPLLQRLLGDSSRELTYFHMTGFTHEPLFSIVSVVALAIFVIYIWRNRGVKDAPFILALILAGLITLNQQIVTGIKIQPGHYYWYFAVPIGIFVSVHMLKTIAPRRWVKPCVVGAVVLTIFATIYGQIQGTIATMPIKLEEQRFRPIVDRLELIDQPSVVLASSDDFAYMYVIFTKHDILWLAAAAQYKADREWMRDAFTVSLLMNAEARTDIEDFLLRTREFRVEPSSYSLDYQFIEGFDSSFHSQSEYMRRVADQDPSLAPLHDRISGELADRFRSALADPNGLSDLLNKYNVSYVVWDEIEQPNWDVSVLPAHRELITENGLHLYELEYVR
jgi:glycosyltransferase involved in cell wall biosynthesis